MQLRHKFFLILTLLTTVPLLILLFGVVEQVDNEIRTRTEKELHVSLDKMAGELRLIIENQQSIARGLTQNPLIQQFASVSKMSLDTADKHREYKRRAEALESYFLNYQKAVPDIQALRFMDNHGKTLVKVKEGKPVEPKLYDDEFRRLFVSDQSNKEFFKQAHVVIQDVVMSDYELGQLNVDTDFCPAMVRYTAKVIDEVERVEGILVVNMWGSRLDSSIQASLGGYPGEAYLVELHEGSARDGIYLYHRDTRRRFADQLKTEFRFSNDISKPEWRHIKNMPDRGSLFRDNGKMLFYQSLAPYPTRPHVRWLLVIEADSNIVLEPVADMRRSIWLLLALLVLISLVISIWAAWRLTRPVNQLAQVMRRYADGDHDSRFMERRNDEIGVAGNAFNYLISQLKRAELERDKAEKVARHSERLASVGQLAAGIGHEINNPLMNIISLAALIESGLDKNKNAEAANDINLLQKEGQRCARIVQNILSFARETPPQKRYFDISLLIQETLNLLHHKLSIAEIKLRMELEKDLQIYGDPNQLQQVLVNILLNAVQASPQGGEIKISTRRDLDYIAIQIHDQGTGVKQEHLGKVFDPFFTTKPEGKGSGLGLSVSYGIVKQHGGTIYLENNIDIGLRVTILLPNRQIAENVLEAHHEETADVV